MSTSYIERGGSVGTNNPNDNNLKMQFWSGDNTEMGKDNRLSDIWNGLSPGSFDSPELAYE